jgi:hypothetical protein
MVNSVMLNSVVGGGHKICMDASIQASTASMVNVFCSPGPWSLVEKTCKCTGDTWNALSRTALKIALAPDEYTYLALICK